MKYNTERKHLKISEYGRHVQDMVDHALSLSDREERNKAAQTIIALMGQMNPHNKDVEDFDHKLWDHLHIIANYELDVDSPYPKPSKEEVEKKPEPLKYPEEIIRYRHYGRSIEKMIDETLTKEGEEREELIRELANTMKSFYLKWNRDSVTDEVIWKNIEALSKGAITQPEGMELIDTQVLVRSHGKPSNTKKKTNSKNKSRQRKSR